MGVIMFDSKTICFKEGVNRKALSAEMSKNIEQK